jgi:hypothetical protein
MAETWSLYNHRVHDRSKRLTTPAGFPGPDDAPDFFRLLKAAFTSQGTSSRSIAFDLLNLNGRNLVPLPSAMP